MLNEKNLTLAGWLSVVLALLTFPYLIILTLFESGENQILDFVVDLFSIGYTTIYVYTSIIFKRLLNEKASFYDADKYISFFIWITIVSTLIGLNSIRSEDIVQSEEILGIGVIFTLILMITLGIIYTVFGIKLLNCNDDLFGYLKPISYLTIAAGVMIATIVLFPLAIIIGVFFDVILAIIFFKASKIF